MNLKYLIVVILNTLLITAQSFSSSTSSSSSPVGSGSDTLAVIPSLISMLIVLVLSGMSL